MCKRSNFRIEQPPVRQATLIVRLWTVGNPVDDDAWRGKAEHIGSGHSCHFNTLDAFISWLRQELAKTEQQLESEKEGQYL